MILALEQVKENFNNPDPRIKVAKESYAKNIMHIHGVNISEYLKQVEGLENDTKIALRKKLALSNKALFSDLLRNTDKIFSAKGGSKDYLIDNENTKKEFKLKLNNIVEGLSLSKWLQNFWLDGVHTDANGLIFVEHKDGEAYPTHKSIDTIRDYKQNGQKVEYVIFEPKKIERNGRIVEIFRVYDDESDRLYIKESDNEIKKVEDEGTEFTNPWGYVPARLISDLIDPLSEFKKTYIHEEIELADQYLRENSIKTLFKYHHGFPYFWMYLSYCSTCKGMGYIKGTDSQSQVACPSCKGTKYAVKKDVSDVTYLRPPQSNDQPVLTELAGYVVPPIETWRQMTEELSMLRSMIEYSHWGTHITVEKSAKTATEVVANLEPINDRLNQYSDSLEIIERGITDILGDFYIGESYGGSSINYGRTYVIKGVNQLNEEYAKLKRDNAGLNLLNEKLKEIIHSKYENDNTNLVINLKLMQIEPLVHNTISGAKGIATPQMYNEKLFYNDWLTTKTRDELFMKDVKALKQELTQFTNEKIKTNGTVQKDSIS